MAEYLALLFFFKKKFVEILEAFFSAYHNVSKHNSAKISPRNHVERAGACTLNED